MLNQSDLLWVRNVKREHGRGWAYMEDESEDEFILHWSSRYVDDKEALKPAVGEVILLFQTPDEKGYTQLTHLVTPLEETVIDCYENNPNFRWGRKVGVLARAVGGINPRPHGLSFQPVNQSHSYLIETISSDLPPSEVKRIIWYSFRQFMNPNFDTLFIQGLAPPVEPPGVNEGAIRAELKLHIYRERNSGIIHQKKAEAENLQCECCGFLFKGTYGEHGADYIECHHRIPINQGERITTPDQLALVCANCHRMLHRRNDKDEYFEVGELKDLIDNLKP